MCRVHQPVMNKFGIGIFLQKKLFKVKREFLRYDMLKIELFFEKVHAKLYGTPKEHFLWDKLEAQTHITFELSSIWLKLQYYQNSVQLKFKSTAIFRKLLYLLKLFNNFTKRESK